VEHKQKVRSLRVAASWQVGIPEAGQDPQASSWRFLARCADQDPDLFFPVGSSGPALRQTMRAKAVCAQCPVRAECLAWALDTGQPHGVWGGLDEQEREQLRGADGESLRAPVARPA
jgi:WhiB family transcriptional regulator, redox-sensing transcriptional regulator